MDKEKERLQKKYNDYVKQVTPTHNLWWNMAKAFVTGGINQQRQHRALHDAVY